MALTKEQYEELQQIGRELDHGTGCMDEPVWEGAVERYHELLELQNKEMVK